MESQFFTFLNWDPQDVMEFTFYDCTLLVPMGDLSAGTVVPFVNINYATGIMDFISTDGKAVTHTFNLHLTAEHVTDE